ncbi:multifunctional CCA addition/repair protein [Oxalobacteraceae bacterium CAVE-383]|nr:multifunctional CCA addition/repair protein [Oxalobacteraceae bacterium CAVE-383]
MDIYTVGGAVRDSLLGLAVKDRDYVVVGATPKQMLALGFRPVGKDFPVFLHPETHEEYALARTERKTAPGYQGFAFHADPDVTLEQDLARRDLTINAIARAADGSLIDPFGGRADLRARLFRHVSDAFAEDPVRILRLARFAARFTNFSVAPQTQALMQAMVRAGEVDALVPERVWQELARGLMEAKPSRMFQVLHDCGALAHILPAFDAAWVCPESAEMPAPIALNASNAEIAAVVDRAADAALPLPVRFACLGLGKCGGVALATELCERLRVPNECRDLALMSAREQDAVAAISTASAEAVVALLMRCDAFRKPQRFGDMLEALQCARQDGPASASAAGAWPPGVFLAGALRAAQTVKAGEVAALYAQAPERIPEAIHAARVGAIAQFREVFA